MIRQIVNAEQFTNLLFLLAATSQLFTLPFQITYLQLEAQTYLINLRYPALTPPGTPFQVLTK